VTRLIAALFLLASCLAVSPVAAQDASQESPADRRRIEREERQERREERREERRLRRLERRERMDQMRERFRRDGVRLRVFDSYTLPEGDTASEPVVVIGGSADIDGHAEDDVVVIGGNLRLGPKAVVDGDVVAVGGELTMDPAAVVKGTVDEATVPWPSLEFVPDWDPGRWWTALVVGGTVFRLFFTLAIAVLLTLVAPGWIGTIAGRPAGTSGLLGFAVEVLLVPALVVLTVVLLVTIVGIPLLAAIPFLLAALAVVWVAGFTGVAVRLGGALRGGRSGSSASVFDLLIGFAAIVGVTIVAHVFAAGLDWLSPISWPVRAAGMAIEYIAWTIGLGAALTSLFAAPRVTPPPVPV